MFDRPEGGELAVLVHVDFARGEVHEELEEFKQLAGSALVTSAAVLTASRSSPHPKYFVGTGKAEEIKQSVLAYKADIVIINSALSPAQQRNLESLFNCRVIDRIGLILDIFAQRARTYEGKLQVELAQLEHLSSRLVRGWTHLERQKGGIGLRGPGETQLEVDRRLIAQRIKSIRKRLDKVQSQRHQSRRARQRAHMPSISLVGYTNAGKSTLFNRLTQSDVYAADKLFATLDPTLRKIKIDSLGQAIIADTVGFIRHLPHALVDAFRATLEETRQADLLLHVVDASDEKRRSHAEQVALVLQEIGADEVPQLMVYNKIDLVPNREPLLERTKQGQIRRVWVSAVTGAGMDVLHHAMAEILQGELHYQTLCLSSQDAKLRAHFYELGAVIDEHTDEEGHCFLTICLPVHEYERLNAARLLPDNKE